MVDVLFLLIFASLFTILRSGKCYSFHVLNCHLTNLFSVEWACLPFTPLCSASSFHQRLIRPRLLQPYSIAAKALTVFLRHDDADVEAAMHALRDGVDDFRSQCLWCLVFSSVHEKRRLISRTRAIDESWLTLHFYHVLVVHIQILRNGCKNNMCNINFKTIPQFFSSWKQKEMENYNRFNFQKHVFHRHFEVALLSGIFCRPVP